MGEHNRSKRSNGEDGAAAEAAPPWLKTEQVARALRVSASTVKRWVDAGVLPACKTAGRHRLIALAGAVELAKRLKLPCAELEALERLGAARVTGIDDRLCHCLEQALGEGRDRDASSFIRAAHAATNASELGDHLIRPVMERIGQAWQFGRLDVFQEHRASQAVARALGERICAASASQLSDRPRPLALGASPDGDLYSLPNLLCELVLLEEGWDVVNLGSNLPLGSLGRAIDQHAPRLVWISVTHVAAPGQFLRDYQAFYRRLAARGVAVILGGQALGPALRARLMATAFGDRLHHLAGFARQWHPAHQSPPGRVRDRSGDGSRS